MVKKYDLFNNNESQNKTKNLIIEELEDDFESENLSFIKKSEKKNAALMENMTERNSDEKF